MFSAEQPKFDIGMKICVFLIFFMIIIFFACGELEKQKRMHCGEEYDSSYARYACLMMILFVASGALFIHPSFVRIPSAMTVFGRFFAQTITSDDFVILPFGNAISIKVSPDGKFIAIANEYAVTLWDVQEKSLIMYDDTIAAYSVRFSNTGRYLAVGGEIPYEKKREDTEYYESSLVKIRDEYPFAARIKNTEESLIAVYEIEEMKRLSHISMLPETISGNITRVRQIAFRPDEKSFVFIYD